MLLQVSHMSQFTRSVTRVIVLAVVTVGTCNLVHTFPIRLGSLVSDDIPENQY